MLYAYKTHFGPIKGILVLLNYEWFSSNKNPPKTSLLEITKLWYSFALAKPTVVCNCLDYKAFKFLKVLLNDFLAELVLEKNFNCEKLCNNFCSSVTNKTKTPITLPLGEFKYILSDLNIIQNQWSNTWSNIIKKDLNEMLCGYYIFVDSSL